MIFTHCLPVKQRDVVSVVLPIGRVANNEPRQISGPVGSGRHRWGRSGNIDCSIFRQIRAVIALNVTEELSWTLLLSGVDTWVW